MYSTVTVVPGLGWQSAHRKITLFTPGGMLLGRSLRCLLCQGPCHRLRPAHSKGTQAFKKLLVCASLLWCSGSKSGELSSVQFYLKALEICGSVWKERHMVVSGLDTSTFGLLMSVTLTLQSEVLTQPH